MICPNCNTQNDVNNRFCVACGKTLDNSAASKNPPLPGTNTPRLPFTRSHSELLGIQTIRLLVLLLGVWLLKVILLWLPFIQDIRIPDLPVSVPILINSSMYILVLLLLVSYASHIRVLWPQAFPRFQEAMAVWVTLIYLGVLAALYRAAATLIASLSNDPNVLTIFQGVLFAAAVFLLTSASITVYRKLPIWLANMHLDAFTMAPSNLVACLNCGGINPAENQVCQHCGLPTRVESPKPSAIHPN